jgi:hypothetical protein
MLRNGMDVCNCPKTKCERHGNCDACTEHHRLNKKYEPYCIRRMQKERLKAEQKAEKQAAKMNKKQA